MTPMKPLAALAALLALSGCAALPGYDSDFSCPSEPLGSPCMSAREVYAANNDGAAAPRSETAQSREPAAAQAEAHPATPVPALTLPGLDAPKPIRTPAKVMRIYLAPWVSQDGALTMPSYVFTEIEPRRWTLGARRIERAGENFYPLQVGESSQGRSAPGNPTSTPAGNPNRGAAASSIGN